MFIPQRGEHTVQGEGAGQVEVMVGWGNHLTPEGEGNGVKVGNGMR